MLINSRSSLGLSWVSRVVNSRTNPGHQLNLGALIPAQSWSYSVLGWVPGILTSLGSFAAFWITSYTLWKFVMKHPHVRDICDIGYLLFGKSRM